MSRRFTALGLALGILLPALFVTAAHAETVSITPDNTWHAFDVDDLQSLSGGLEWISNADGSALEFTFTTLASTALTVVDMGFGGDRFDVLDNGVSLGLTSNATNTYPSNIGTSFDAALADSRYSFATYLLAAGTHHITGQLAQSALDDSGDPLNATLGDWRRCLCPRACSCC